MIDIALCLMKISFVLHDNMSLGWYKSVFRKLH